MRYRFATMSAAFLVIGACSAHADGYDSKVTSFTFNISNDTSVDLTFKLDPNKKKNIKFYVDGQSETSTVIKAGDEGAIILQPANEKFCSKTCESCDAAKGQIDVYYKDPSGDLQMNDFYETPYAFSQYCSKDTTTFSSSWDFNHHKGNGDDYYPHSQDHKTPVVTNQSGYTFSSKTAAKADITFTDPDAAKRRRPGRDG
jgi:hypothetical protein